MIKIILIPVILILGVPIGYLLAYLCRDELKEGKKYFKLIVLISSVLAVVFLFFNLVTAISLVFIAIVTGISLIKSQDKKFIK